MEGQLKPTESELEILQILWSRGVATVRQVNEELLKQREVGYTTTLKIMQIMFEKGMLTREEEGRYHVYKAKAEERGTQNLLLNRFIEKTFRGSASKMVMEALGNQKVSKEEIDEIKELLKKLEA
jgi:BlaI family penicillinase repressor